MLNAQTFHHVEYGFHSMSVGYMFIHEKEAMLLEAKGENIC